ncbi:F-box protein At5g03100 [Linum grandiflorum]
MEKPPKKSAAGGENLISNLPDEILHSVLRRIPCSREAAATAALSRRWGNLWRSYPVVDFDSRSVAGGNLWKYSYPKVIKGFQRFSEATIERFSSDKQLRMETLKISLDADKDNLVSLAVGVGFPAVEQLLHLASKRKAESVTIKVTDKYVVCLPLGLLTSSTAKTLHFEGIRLVLNKNIDDLCLNSLRSLILHHVELDGGERLLTSLIASSPLLQTLKLEFVRGMRKLSMCNVANLKELKIYSCDGLEEIEIAASSLETVRISLYHVPHPVLKLIAPQLNSLDIEYCDISRLVISELQFLKSLNLSKTIGDLPLLPRSVRFLCLDDLELTDEQLLLNVIDGSRFLETLKLEKIKTLRRLQVVNLPNLNTLDIIDCYSIEEIEIAAFELQSLNLHGWEYWMMELSKIELIAPKLNELWIINSGLNVGDVEGVVSKLLSLKSLYLGGFHPTEKKIKLSGRKLQEITLSGLSGLEEIEIDVVPRLKKFMLVYDDDDESVPADQIKKCEIKNSPASCQLEVDFQMRSSHAYDGSSRSWFVEFKSFIARFPKFHTVSVYFASATMFTMEREDMDYTVRPTAIPHLKIRSSLCGDLLESLFWACHPKLLTLGSLFCDHEEYLYVFLSHYLPDPVATDDNDNKFDEYLHWRHQLKSVRVITEGADYVVEKEKGLRATIDDLYELLKAQDDVRLMLTWY